MKSAASAPRKRRHLARQWHRWLGLLAAFPVLWLAISGLLLNHAAPLGLNDRMVSGGWILRHYNQLPEAEPTGITVGDRLVTEWDGLLFLDSAPLALRGRLVGAEALQDRLVVATTQEIGILDGSDDLLLQLDELSLPGVPLEAIAVKNDRLLVAAHAQWFQLSDDFFTSEETAEVTELNTPASLDSAQRESLAIAIRSRRAMPLSRIILDAHSGSLFGWPGWLLTDLAALGLIILTVLGLRLFPRRRS